jgi:hypothetical protein
VFTHYRSTLRSKLPFLSRVVADMAALDTNKCIAKAWSKSGGVRAWAQCSRDSQPPHLLCQRHIAGTPNGVWVAQPAAVPIALVMPVAAKAVIRAAMRVVIQTKLRPHLSFFHDDTDWSAAGGSHLEPGFSTVADLVWDGGDDDAQIYPADWLGGDTSTPQFTTTSSTEVGADAVAFPEDWLEVDDDEGVREADAASDNDNADAGDLDEGLMDCSFSSAELRRALKAQTADATPHSDGEKQLFAFALFCLGNSDKLEPLGATPTDTSYGTLYLTEHAVLHYLKAIQTDTPVRANTLLSKFTNLKKGIRQLGLSVQHMPAWALQGTKPGEKIDEYLRKMTTAQTASAGAALPDAVLGTEDIEEIALGMVVQIRLSGDGYCIMEAINILFGRLQSGRSPRTLDLFRIMMTDAGYSPGADGGPPVPYIDVGTLKPLAGMGLAAAVKAKAKSRIYLTDQITQSLFSVWWAWVPAEVQTSSTSYFFPKQGKDGFHYESPMRYRTANAFVQHWAMLLGLVIDDRHHRSFTTKSIRKGVAAESVRLMKEFMVTRNLHLGRASSSNMEVSTYCPRRVLMAPGPLHDRHHSDAILAQALTRAGEERKTHILCAACGYANCSCEACAGAGRKRKLHACWLSKMNGKLGKRAKTGPPEANLSDSRYYAYVK